MLAAFFPLLLISAEPDGAKSLFVRPEPSTLTRVFGSRFSVELRSFELLKVNYEEWTTPFVSSDGVRAFIGTHEGRLECRDLGTSELLWVRTDMGAIGASMVEHRGLLWLGSDSSLVGLDQQLGRERKRVDLGGAIGGRMVVTGTVALIPLRPNMVMAVDLAAGKEIWRQKRPTPEGITVRGQAAPAIDKARKRAYLGFSDGVLVAVSLDSGAPQWSATLGNARDFFADVDTQVVITDGGRALIAASYNGGLYKLDAESGKVIWKKDLLRISGLVAAEPGLLVASDGNGEVIGIYAENGKVRWRYKLGKGAPSEPIFLGRDMVAVAKSQGPLAILDTGTGQPIQLIATGSGISAAPFFRDPDLVLLSNRGLFLATRYGEGTSVSPANTGGKADF